MSRDIDIDRIGPPEVDVESVLSEVQFDDIGQNRVIQIFGDGGVNAQDLGDGTWIVESDPPPDFSNLSFYWQLFGAEFHWNAGSLGIVGTMYDIAASAIPSTVVLSGSTEYTYIYHKKNHSSSGIANSSTDPGMGDGTEWRWRLGKFTAVATGQYKIDKEYYRYGGDIVCAVPMR